jgi:hypothetical protein
MLDTNQPSDLEGKAERLARLAEVLRLEITDENLAALANQLRLIDALEQSELHEYPPILRMDADWHD